MARVSQASLSQRVRIAEILLVVIVVVGAIMVTNAVVGVGGLMGSTYQVTVELSNAAGLHDNSDVTYRGQYIGTVKQVRLDKNGVIATLTIEDSVKIPVNTQVVVADLSAVGEQYLDFRPNTDSGPYLGDRSVIATNITTPLPTWQVFADVQRLVGNIAPTDIESISRQVTAIFGPGDVDLSSLTNEVIGTLHIADKLSAAAFSIIDNAQAPLSTLADLAPDMRTFAINARSLANALRAADPTLASLLERGAIVVPVVSSLVSQLTPVVVKLLADGTPVAVMAARHIPGLKHWFQFGPGQLSAMASATRDGSGWVILAISPANNCLYGPQISAYQKNTSLPLSARCTTVNPHIQQRGAQYVPQQ